MAKLEHTTVYRGGVTAPHLTVETKAYTFNPNISEQALDFRFRLASKGGGTTSVLLQIGLADLPEMLRAVATAIPESVGTLSECAAIANEKILQLLTEARRVQNDEKARANSLVDKLEAVEKFVSQKYYEAPAGQDEHETTVKAQLEEVVNSLRQLS